MTVLVTGATGFVGRQVVRDLSQRGVEVAALVRPSSRRKSPDDLKGVRIVEADLEDRPALSEQVGLVRPDACIHLAWFAEPGKYLDAPENLDSLRASLGLLEELARAGCRHVVGVGTCFEYDLRPMAMREDSPTKPEALYSATKLAFKLVAEQRLAQLGMEMAWARLFYLYGPFEDERRLIPAVIEALTANRAFEATPGQQVRDYLHVEDVASALSLLSLRALTGTFNVCSGEPVTLAELLRILSEMMGREGLIRLGAVPYRKREPMFVCGDNQRLRTEAEWHPRYTLRSGLAATLEWRRQQR